MGAVGEAGRLDTERREERACQTQQACLLARSAGISLPPSGTSHQRTYAPQTSPSVSELVASPSSSCLTGQAGVPTSSLSPSGRELHHPVSAGDGLGVASSGPTTKPWRRVQAQAPEPW